jgi:hypothetical protein
MRRIANAGKSLIRKSEVGGANHEADRERMRNITFFLVFLFLNKFVIL